jgi:hypothetical protein
MREETAIVTMPVNIYLLVYIRSMIFRFQ